MPLDRVPGEQFDVLVDDAMAGPGIRVRVAPLLCVSSHSKGLSCRPRDARAARSPSAPQHIPESTTGGTPWEHIVF